MIQLLPAAGFEWVDLSKFTLDSYENEGYLLEVDIRYPKELHDPHNDLLFMCKKMVISGVEKLVPNLHDKRNYVVHIKALNQALSHGLVLGNVHRVIKFNQRVWLKPYIDFNTRLRTQAKNDFEKDFLKLINNAVFGKQWRTLGSIRISSS